MKFKWTDKIIKYECIVCGGPDRPPCTTETIEDMGRPKKCPVNVPRVVVAEDYHEFNEMQYVLDFVLPGVKVIEIGFDGWNYVGLIYTGPQPKKSIVAQLLDDSCVELENSDEM